MRVFVGLAADAATVQAVQALRRDWPQPLDWVADTNLHLTLAFLGEIEPARLPVLAAALRPVAAVQPAFTLHWTQLAWFPSAHHARVLALLPADSPQLLAWQQHLVAALQAAGWPPETRPYRPHLSLARVRRAAAALPPAAPGLPCTMAVTALTLFRSDRAPQGMHYSPCFSLPLASADGSSAAW